MHTRGSGAGGEEAHQQKEVSALLTATARYGTRTLCACGRGCGLCEVTCPRVWQENGGKPLVGADLGDEVAPGARLDAGDAVCEEGARDEQAALDQDEQGLPREQLGHASAHVADSIGRRPGSNVNAAHA